MSTAIITDLGRLEPSALLDMFTCPEKKRQCGYIGFLKQMKLGGEVNGTRSELQIYG